jgi:hypothetical protein
MAFQQLWGLWQSKLHVEALPESLVKKVELLMSTAAVVAFQAPLDGLIDEAAGSLPSGPTRKNDSKFFIRMRRFGERSGDSGPASTPTVVRPLVRSFPTTGLTFAKESVLPSRPRDTGSTAVPIPSPALHLGVVVSIDTFHGVLRPHGLQNKTESVRIWFSPAVSPDHQLTALISCGFCVRCPASCVSAV